MAFITNGKAKKYDECKSVQSYTSSVCLFIKKVRSTNVIQYDTQSLLHKHFILTGQTGDNFATPITCADFLGTHVRHLVFGHIDQIVHGMDHPRFLMVVIAKWLRQEPMESHSHALPRGTSAGAPQGC